LIAVRFKSLIMNKILYFIKRKINFIKRKINLKSDKYTNIIYNNKLDLAIINIYKSKIEVYNR